LALVAEQVEKVNPDLIVRDENGKVTTVLRSSHRDAAQISQENLTVSNGLALSSEEQ
jgi:hypothetical protein